jgi:sugar phosphate isomerase/epimerase
MNIRNLSQGWLCLALSLTLSCSTEKEPDNVFYCFNNCVSTLPGAPAGFEAQAALVKRLGYDGLAGHGEEYYYQLREALDRVGLEMPEIYIAMSIVDGKVVYHEGLKDILEHAGDRHLLVTLHLHADDFTGSKREGDALFIEGIRELSDFARPLNVDIAIYPHVNFYCETLAHAVDLARQIDRENAGMTVNLCHLLKVEGEKGWEEKVLATMPYTFMVSINGADSGNTREMGWDKLIQPLGEGSFDTYSLVKLLKDNGYDGKFGLQCYNINQDCEVALTWSIRTWKAYQSRYREESTAH